MVVCEISSNGTTTTQAATVKTKTLPTESKIDIECDQARKSSANGLAQKSTDSKPGPITKNGSVRHLLAILALSAIVMANMNRQAYNQALVRMIKKNPARQDGAKQLERTNSTGANDQATVPTQAPFGPTSTEEAPDHTTPSAPPLSTPSQAFTGMYAADPIDPIVGAELVVSPGPATIEPERNGTGHNNDNDHNAADDDDDDDDDGFDWTGSQIGLLQAGFSYGYTFFMIPGGRLSEIYGAKWVIFLSGFGSALCSILTPFIASRSYALLVASRVFMGLCQTGISPALYAFCTRWLPPDESTVYLPMIKVGVMIGFMLGSLINGFMPWRIMFYVVGVAGFLWSMLWVCFATSEPKDQRFLSKSELAYIEHCLQQSRARESSSSASKAGKGSSSAPWLNIITNPVVLAFTFTKFTVKLSTDTQTMQLPMYLRNVHKVADSLNGILNGANFAIQACFTGLVAYSAKEMVSRRPFGLTKTGVRIIFQSINCFGMALGYLLISFNMGSLELVCCAVMLLSIASMFGSGGEAVLPVDLTTEYAASIMAIANSMANISGIVMPQMVSLLLANHLTSSTRWNHVWWMVCAIMTSGGLVFSLFVKAELQDFNRSRSEKKKQKRDDRSLNSQLAISLNTDGQNSWSTKL
jgi:MFS family permease